MCRNRVIQNPRVTLSHVKNVLHCAQNDSSYPFPGFERPQYLKRWIIYNESILIRSLGFHFLFDTAEVSRAPSLTSSSWKFLLKTSSMYFVIYLLFKNGRYSYFISYQERMFPKRALVFNAMVVSLIFPGICSIQNFMAFYIMRCRQQHKFCENNLFKKDLRGFLVHLKTNYLVTNTLKLFCPLASNVTILIGYIFYFLPMLLACVFISVIDPGIILCSNLRLVSKFKCVKIYTHC